jgi:hypothetical protein
MSEGQKQVTWSLTPLSSFCRSADSLDGSMQTLT